MNIKRILVPFTSSYSIAAEAEAAISTAKVLEAHVEAIFIKEPPTEIRIGEVGNRAALAANRLQSHEQEIEENDRRMDERRQQFIRACESNSVPIVNGSDAAMNFPTASWRELEGAFAATVLSQAAGFDLVIASSASVVEPLKEIAEGTLLQTRRPVLLAPTRMQKEIDKKVMIAWDESPECWHAVSAAIPFLQHAENTLIVSIDKENDTRRSSQEKVRFYLNCHGIDAETRIVAPTSGSIGEAILMVAGDEGASLVVMGAYSHSRFREMLLGGPTHHVLKTASATPVLMAH